MRLDPYQPSPELPWDRDLASHLARRSGFAALPQTVKELVEGGPAKAVERVTGFAGYPAPDLESVVDGKELPPIERAIWERGGALVDFAGESVPDSVEHLRRQWVLRMALESHPLRERLTLFWHDHLPCKNPRWCIFPCSKNTWRCCASMGRAGFASCWSGWLGTRPC